MAAQRPQAKERNNFADFASIGASDALTLRVDWNPNCCCSRCDDIGSEADRFTGIGDDDRRMEGVPANIRNSIATEFTANRIKQCKQQPLAQ